MTKSEIIKQHCEANGIPCTDLSTSASYEIFDCMYMLGINGHSGPYATLGDALDASVRHINGCSTQVSSVICERTPNGYVPFLELSELVYNGDAHEYKGVTMLRLHTCTAKRLG